MDEKGDDSRFDQGPPGMLPDGQINTLGPDGKPTHPITVYTKDGDTFTVDEYEQEENPDDLADLGEVEKVFGEPA